MTEIKIPFIKTHAQEYTGSNKPANAKALELEISTTFNFKEVYEKMPLSANVERIKIGFWDGAETSLFNDLLDENNVSFELSFEKEKVNFWVVGEEEFQKDDTKVEIICFPRENSSLEFHFKPQTAGVVKIAYQGPKKPNKDNSSLDKEIVNLKNRIKELEEKNQNIPNSDAYTQEIENLKKQLQDKEKEANRERERERERAKQKRVYEMWETSASSERTRRSRNS
jgi:hypothetical protein